MSAVMLAVSSELIRATPAPLTHPRQDPAHLHLAAYALAYPVLSGTMPFSEAASCLALAAIAVGMLDQMTDRQFDMLRERLERTLVRATVDIEDRRAAAIRQAIEPGIERRYPVPVIRDMARLENLLSPVMRIAPLSIEAVEEICRQEIRKALTTDAIEGRTANG